MEKSKKESGQLMIEAVLVMVLIAGLAAFIQRQFSDRNIIGNMLQGPWSSVQQMMLTGEWDKSLSFDEAHPQSKPISREGDER